MGWELEKRLKEAGFPETLEGRQQWALESNDPDVHKMGEEMAEMDRRIAEARRERLRATGSQAKPEEQSKA
jgi:hypothetical protein